MNSYPRPISLRRRKKREEKVIRNCTSLKPVWNFKFDFYDTENNPKGFRRRYITLRTWKFQSLFIFLFLKTKLRFAVQLIEWGCWFYFILVHGLFFWGKWILKCLYILISSYWLGDLIFLLFSEMKEFYLYFIKRFHKYVIGKY